MQDGTKAHRANYSINLLNEVPDDSLIGQRLWPASSPDLNPCDFYLWGNLKNNVHSSNLHTVDEFTHNICDTITSIKASELKIMSNNFFRRLEVCFKLQGRNFEH
jgi:inhibitor of nuclear factor kappa-B kinase subunit alpha